MASTPPEPQATSLPTKKEEIEKISINSTKSDENIVETVPQAKDGGFESVSKEKTEIICNEETTCNNHGTCENDKCVCYNPWGSDDCSVDLCLQHSKSCQSCWKATTDNNGNLSCMWDELDGTCLAASTDPITGKGPQFQCSQVPSYFNGFILVASLIGIFSLVRMVRRRRRQSGDYLGSKSYEMVPQSEKADEVWEDWEDDHGQGPDFSSGRKGLAEDPSKDATVKSSKRTAVAKDSAVCEEDGDIFAELGIEARPVFASKDSFRVVKDESRVASMFVSETASGGDWDDGLDDLEA
mmetsp:Transcript_11838/g.17648  ORF Transcript_11838/g.17648 Transcript_11838/m.17648 type:complete len:297 (+) Transcript_11838:3-893(+)